MLKMRLRAVMKQARLQLHVPDDSAPTQHSTVDRLFAGSSDASGEETLPFMDGVLDSLSCMLEITMRSEAHVVLYRLHRMRTHKALGVHGAAAPYGNSAPLVACTPQARLAPTSSPHPYPHDCLRCVQVLVLGDAVLKGAGIGLQAAIPISGTTHGTYTAAATAPPPMAVAPQGRSAAKVTVPKAASKKAAAANGGDRAVHSRRWRSPPTPSTQGLSCGSSKLMLGSSFASRSSDLDEASLRLEWSSSRRGIIDDEEEDSRRSQIVEAEAELSKLRYRHAEILSKIMSTRELTSIDQQVNALRNAALTHMEGMEGLRARLLELHMKDPKSTRFAGAWLHEPIHSKVDSFGEHFANLQVWMHEASCFDNHAPGYPAARSFAKSFDEQAMEREVDRSLLVLQVNSYKDQAQTSEEQLHTSVFESVDLVDRSVWQANLHVNALDAKVHIPFLLRLLAFFIKPRMVEPISMMVPVETDPIMIAGSASWRVDVLLRQTELTLINHTHGPNMPLLKLRLRDTYLLGVHQRRTAFQLDLQLLLEALSYNYETDEPAFESLVEPLVLALRTSDRPRTADLFTAFQGLRSETAYKSKTVSIAASPINVTLTQSALAALLRVVPSVQAAVEQYLPGPAPVQSAAGVRADVAHEPPSAEPVEADDASGSSAALGFIKSPYWVRNSLGVEVRHKLPSRQRPLALARPGRGARPCHVNTSLKSWWL